MSTRRQRQILRNRKLEFERKMDENIKKSKAVEPEETPEKKEEVKIVKKKKTTKKEDK